MLKSISNVLHSLIINHYCQMSAGRNAILLRPQWVISNQLTMPLVTIADSGTKSVRGLASVLIPITIYLDTLFADKIKVLNGRQAYNQIKIILKLEFFNNRLLENILFAFVLFNCKPKGAWMRNSFKSTKALRAHLQLRELMVKRAFFALSAKCKLVNQESTR